MERDLHLWDLCTGSSFGAFGMTGGCADPQIYHSWWFIVFNYGYNWHKNWGWVWMSHILLMFYDGWLWLVRTPKNTLESPNPKSCAEGTYLGVPALSLKIAWSPVQNEQLVLETHTGSKSLTQGILNQGLDIFPYMVYYLKITSSTVDWVDGTQGHATRRDAVLTQQVVIRHPNVVGENG